MHDTLPLTAHLLDSALPLIVALSRTTGLFLTEPFLSSPVFPTRARLAAALGVSAAMLPVVAPLVPSEAPGVLAMIGIVAAEGAVGVLIGMALNVVVAAVRFAGSMAGMQVGLRADAMVDPMSGGASGDVTSNLTGLIALAVLVAGNAHHHAIRALARTYEHVPPGGFTVTGPVAEAASRLTGMVISVGLGISMPVLAAVLLTQLGLALLGRTVPQLNVFVVGFLVTITVGLLAVALSMATFPVAMGRAVDRSLSLVLPLVAR